MDIYETRIKHLREIIGDNQLKDFAQAFDLDASYLSQLLNGHRRMGERAAGAIESKLGLMQGTLGVPKFHVGIVVTLHHRFNEVGLKHGPKIVDLDDSNVITYSMDFLTEEELAERKRREGLSFPEAIEEDAQESGDSGHSELGSLDHQFRAVPEVKELGIKQGSVPVIGKAMLGTDGYFEAIDFPVGVGDGRLMVPSNDPNAYGLRVVGTSMTPRIKNGEYVLIEPNHPYVSGDEVMVRTASGQAMIKEFIYHRDGLYRFDSVNPGHPPLLIEEEKVDKIHYVGGILKSSRFVDDLDF
ncbi:S24 family peptidase [Pseudomonas sp. CAN2814]|uniref:LexA family transcriptional regulator n=1 Tax=Pseudomonas sp. CAN1 TaxID=3046726 RepID=UPI0026499E09|nr:S24 family peptidase [Pseudomonas sp. CAN1]MDN6857253.1 S24 family peptidase [Pseudomonas sp. CAN1]